MKQSGITLVEMLLYIGILAVFLAILSNIFTTVINVQLASESTSSVHTDGQYILARLTHDISRAQGITTPASPGEQGNTLLLTIGGTSYSYALSGDNLQITDLSGTSTLNSFDTSVSALNFLRTGNTGGKNAVTVNFTLQSRTVPSLGSETSNFQITVGTR